MDARVLATTAPNKEGCPFPMFRTVRISCSDAVVLRRHAGGNSDQHDHNHRGYRGAPKRHPHVHYRLPCLSKYNPGIPDITETFRRDFSIASTTATTVSGYFTIQMSKGNLTGTVTFAARPSCWARPQLAPVPHSITGGTGGATYSGSTGSFSSLSGSSLGSASTGLVFSFTGPDRSPPGRRRAAAPPSGPTPTVTAVLDAGSYTSGTRGRHLRREGFEPQRQRLRFFGLPAPGHI